MSGKTQNRGIIGQLRGTVAAPLSTEQRLEEQRRQTEQEIRAAGSQGLKLVRQAALYTQLPDEIQSYEQVISLASPDDWANQLLDALPANEIDLDDLFAALARRRVGGIKQFFESEKDPGFDRIAKLAALVLADLETTGEPQISTSLLVQNAIQTAELIEVKLALKMVLVTKNPGAAMENVLSQGKDNRIWSWLLVNERLGFLEALRAQNNDRD